jgi:hypothetical protein
MSRPLRSTPITGASPLLRAGPPARRATVLSPPVSASGRSLSPPQPSGRPCRSTPSHVPCRSRRSDSRRLHAGHHLANNRAPARLIPEILPLSGFDVIYTISTRLQRFACARLPDPHLTPQGAFSSSLTTTVINQRSMRRFDASPRRATPKGHNPFITRTAPNSKVPTRPPPSLVAHGKSVHS